jgi:hypothetical protein
MTFTISDNQLYVGIIIVLILIQIYQQKLIRDLQKETHDIWNQIAILVTTLSAELTGLQKSLSNKKDKE